MAANPSNGRASVRVRLEVEVCVGVWNDTESFGSLAAQASKEAEQKMFNICAKQKDVRVVGQPKSMHVVLSAEV